MFNEHDVSIPDNALHYSGMPMGNSTDVHSTTMNVVPLQTCEAREEGICCQSDATRIYPTSEGIERHLCDYHFYKLLRLIYAWHLIRREMRGAA